MTAPDLPPPDVFRPDSTQALLDQLEAGVRAAGGAALPGRHIGRDVIYALKPSGWPSGLRWVPQPNERTCGCGNETRLAIPPSKQRGTEPAAVVCALCDAAVLFPRFR